MTIMDGREVSRACRDALRDTHLTPCLTVIQVGDDPASNVYVRNKRRAFKDMGWRFQHVHAPDTCTKHELVHAIRLCNADDSVHGIIVQLPLPDTLDPDEILSEIVPEKDVDGFNPDSNFIPCTALGIMRMLMYYGIPTQGWHAVVVGRSNIVGKPVADNLLAWDATVTVCHSHTRDLAHFTRQADILIVAAGKPNLITADMVKPGGVVIDAGINRVNGKVVGDVDFDAVKDVAGWITPVPGGVGPMTITGLLWNTRKAAEMQEERL